MEYCIVSVSLAFLWLLIETDFLRIRLPYGKNPDASIKMLNPGKSVLMLPSPKMESYFVPCDIDNPDVVSKRVVNIGAKIL